MNLILRMATSCSPLAVLQFCLSAPSWASAILARAQLHGVRRAISVVSVVSQWNLNVCLCDFTACGLTFTAHTNSPSCGPIAAFACLRGHCKGFASTRIFQFKKCEFSDILILNRTENVLSTFIRLNIFSELKTNKQKNVSPLLSAVKSCNLTAWHSISSMRSFTGHSWAGFYA